MSDDQTKADEEVKKLAEEIVEKICVEPEHRVVQRMTPWFQEYVLLVEQALTQARQEGAAQGSLSGQYRGLCVALGKFTEFGSKAKVFYAIEGEIKLLEASQLAAKNINSQQKP
jgi:hypothetical protein